MHSTIVLAAGAAEPPTSGGDGDGELSGGRGVVRGRRCIEEGDLLHGLAAVRELLGEVGDVIADEPGTHPDGALVIAAVCDLSIVATQGLDTLLLEDSHAPLGAFQLLAVLAALVFLLHASGDRSSVPVPRRLRNWTSSATISATPRSLPSSSWKRRYCSRPST